MSVATSRTIRCKHHSEQRFCPHTEMEWAILVIAGDREQIRWTCKACGKRTDQAARFADHPNHRNYPLIVPHPDPCSCHATTIERARVDDYAEYLQSPQWRSKRPYYLGKAMYRCQLCNKAGGPDGRGLDVHHRTYERVGAEIDADLIVLCRDCHSRHHGHIGEVA